MVDRSVTRILSEFAFTETGEDAHPDTDSGAQSGESKLVRGLVALSKVLGAITVFVGICVFAALVGVVLYEIIGRDFLGGARTWTNDVSDDLFIWLVLLGGSVAVADRSEPSISMIADRMNPAMRRFCAGFSDGVSIFVFAYLLVYGVRLTSFLVPTMTQSGFSAGYVAASVPVCAGLMLLHKLVQLAQGLESADTKERATRLVVGALVVGVGFAVVSTHALDTIDQRLVYVPLLAILALSLALGTPIGEALLAAAAVTYGLTDAFSSGLSLTQQVYSGLDVFTFVAIPLFLLTGVIVASTSAAPRLAEFCKALLGWLPGGLAVADIAASAVFADVSGSAVADTVALTQTFVPELVSDGYPIEFAGGMQAAAGTLGILYPPSISMLLFASVTSTSVGALFAALLVPAVIVTLSFTIVCVVLARRRGYGTRSRFQTRSTWRAFWRALPAFATLAIVLGGIFGGVFTATEAGAVAATYSLIVAALGYRERGQRVFIPAARNAVATVGRVGFIIAAALVFGWYLVQNNGPQDLVSAITGPHLPVDLTLLIIILFLILVSTVAESSTTILVIVPLLLPSLAVMNVNLLHFGVLLQLAAATGLILPPLGLCLFLVSAAAGVSVTAAGRAAVPFVITLAVNIVLVLAIPQLTTTLPRLLGL